MNASIDDIEEYIPAEPDRQIDGVDLRDVPFAGGFAFLQSDLPEVAHMRRALLPDGWQFWFDALVGTAYYICNDSDFSLLRGHWADLSSDETPQADIPRKLLDLHRDSEELFHEQISLLAGRFVLIIRTEGRVRIYHDSLGTRTVYYSVTEDTVASHLRLLRRLAPEGNRIHRTAAEVALSMDDTFYDGLRQLLPNFYLDLRAHRPVRYFPERENKYLQWSHEEKLELVKELWVRQLRAYAISHPKTLLSISGGLDSRLTVALSKGCLSGIHGYTYGCLETSTRHMSPKESAIYHRLHRDVMRAKEVVALTDIASHTLFDVTDSKVFREAPTIPDDLSRLFRLNGWWSHSRSMIPRYREAFSGGSWLHLRSTGVEVVRRYWNAPDSFEGVLDMIWRRSSQTIPAEMIAERAHELGYAKDPHGFHRIDLMYWEIRMGKWHAELINESDVAYDTLVPLGTREMLEILLSYVESDRKAGFAVRELINCSDPIMNFLGCNDSRNLYEQWRDAVRVSADQ